MANTAGIAECTLAQLADRTSAINTIGAGATNARSAYNQVAICRVTDHPGDDGSTGSDTSGMALYKNVTHLDRWVHYNGGDATASDGVLPVDP